MSGSLSTINIEKLIGRENYSTWKFAVKNYLEHEELWETIEPGPNYVDDKKRDTKAKSKIILLVDPTIYVHVQEATTAKEVWQNLQKVFDDSGLTRKLVLQWMRTLGMWTPVPQCICVEIMNGCIM
ncbi:uncharacterized protein LOC119193832 [Manduca sexta]|uniref:uncharacterized protein LOC119193832 n=1 Tax=Manduca sexta TaxID=7130 RepID=UPI00188F36EC|nr:uncharacterized protein LOC119193832 [Manduca sexta]